MGSRAGGRPSVSHRFSVVGWGSRRVRSPNQAAAWMRGGMRGADWMRGGMRGAITSAGGEEDDTRIGCGGEDETAIGCVLVPDPLASGVAGLSALASPTRSRVPRRRPSLSRAGISSSRSRVARSSPPPRDAGCGGCTIDEGGSYMAVTFLRRARARPVMGSAQDDHHLTR
jgi:hypothetical protein